MARNGSGNYTKVNTFTAGTPITAASHNQNWDDVAAEITNSVAADGQTTMTGPLKAASGTAAAPSLSFGSDPDTGAYRRGSNELGFAVGGVAAGYFDSAKKFYALGALDVSGDLTVAGVAKFPIITADITDAAVTYAKIQDVSATARILGRKTAAAGDVEECTLSEILDFVGSAANGDMLIRSGGTWVRLAKATDGNALIQAAGLPAWGGSPAMFQISSQTASSSSSIAFTSGIDATYSQYVVCINAARPATDAVQFLMEVSTDGGSNWKTSSYLGGPWTTNTGGATTNIASTSFFSLSRSGVMSNSSSQGWRGYVTIFDPSSTGYKSFNATGSHLVSGGTIYENVQGGGIYNGVTTAINAIRFRMSSNSIADGTFTLYGIK